MKDLLVPIDKAGRVVVPKEMRDELAIKPGDLFKITIQGNAVMLQPTKEASGFIKRGKALVFSSAAADLLDNDTVNAIRETIQGGRLNELSGGLPSPRRK